MVSVAISKIFTVQFILLTVPNILRIMIGPLALPVLIGIYYMTRCPQPSWFLIWSFFVASILTLVLIICLFYLVCFILVLVHDHILVLEVILPNCQDFCWPGPVSDLHQTRPDDRLPGGL